MFCPNCSTQSVEGAKFCKSCGMNLNVITQALNGGVVISDPLRDREYKRARKQISDGIQGSAIGAAMLIAAGIAFYLIRNNTVIYALSLITALAGIIKLFRSIGSIVDAKVGQKFLDPELQPRGTGGLSSAQIPAATAVNVRPSQRLNGDPSKMAKRPAPTKPISFQKPEDAPPLKPAQKNEPPPRVGTGRVNREHSSPLKKLDQGDDIFQKLRN